MNKQKLNEIKARAEAATPGPWNRDGEYHIHDPNPVLVASVRQQAEDYPLICEVRYPRQESNVANIKFIAHAREDVPALVKEVERLQAALEFYANPYSWAVGADANWLQSVYRDRGAAAREVLSK